MNKRLFQIITLLLIALVLGACAKKPETVTEVSKVFWSAVISNDAGDAVEYSTLESAEQFDRFGRQWQNMIPSWGQVVIEGDQARVNTQVSAPDASDADMLYFVTYLVKTADGWKVDYDRTAKAVRAAGAVVDFVDRIATIGEEIQHQFDETSENLAIQMTAVVDQIDRMTEDYQDRAGQAVDRAAGNIRQLLDQLSASLKRAMEDLKDPDDSQLRKQIEDSIDRLEASSREMVNPSLDAIANAGKQVITVADELMTASEGRLKQYAEEWNRILDQFDQELSRFIDAYTSSDGEAQTPADAQSSN